MREHAAQIVRGLHSSERSATYATFGESFRKAIPLEQVDAITQGIEASKGRLVDARVADDDGPGAAMRTMSVVAFFERGASIYSISLDREGILRGLRVEPFSKKSAQGGKGPADDYIAKHVYALPLRGKWSVGNGGRDPRDNGHVGNPQQWYAFDLLRMGPDGKTFRTEGKTLADYYAFDEPVVAPADGVVVRVIDGSPDNAPGDEDAYVIVGNAVVIDHGEGEFSFLAHLRLGSIKVKVGTHLKAGDPIARVGNSGHTSEPHLHWHLGSDADLTKSHGLPIRFVPLSMNGKSESDAQPKRGDEIESTADPVKSARSTPPPR